LIFYQNGNYFLRIVFWKNTNAKPRSRAIAARIAYCSGPVCILIASDKSPSVVSQDFVSFSKTALTTKSSNFIASPVISIVIIGSVIFSTSLS
jgi:hypothetical protein